MKYHPFKILLGCLSFAAVLAVSAGCASTTYNKGTATANTLQASADAVAQTSVRMNDVLVALDNLTANPTGDLRAPYDNFAKAADKLHKSTDKLDAAVEDMHATGAAYLQNWGNEMATIQSADIRSRSSDRRAQISVKLHAITSSYLSVKGDLAPFASGIHDIQTYLGTDLTLDGITSIKPVVAKTKADAGPLHDSIKKLQISFNDLSRALSPILQTADKGNGPAN